MWSVVFMALSATAVPSEANVNEPTCRGNPSSPYCTLPLYHFHDSIEVQINKQINREIEASNIYMELASHFNRDDINKKGFGKFFMDNSDEERDHAKKLVDYLNDRDGYWSGYSTPGNAPTLTKPSALDKENGLTAIRFALLLEKEVSLKLVELRLLAVKLNDVHLFDMLESSMLQEQVESVRELTGMLANLEAMYTDPRGYALAEWLYDQELQS